MIFSGLTLRGECKYLIFFHNSLYTAGFLNIGISNRSANDLNFYNLDVIDNFIGFDLDQKEDTLMKENCLITCNDSLYGRRFSAITFLNNNFGY
jgi:hypothetical protein